MYEVILMRIQLAHYSKTVKASHQFCNIPPIYEEMVLKWLRNRKKRVKAIWE